MWISQTPSIASVRPFIVFLNLTRPVRLVRAAARKAYNHAEPPQLAGNFRLARIETKALLETLLGRINLVLAQIITAHSLVPFRRFRREPNGLLVARQCIFSGAFLFKSLAKLHRLLPRVIGLADILLGAGAGLGLLAAVKEQPYHCRLRSAIDWVKTQRRLIMVLRL